tara:strand:- start:1098 stop:1943 length:846 start_codon:yes stop_codon:yes gene_type:complete
MNYLEALNYGNKILKSRKIINYNLDSQILLSKVLNLSRERLLINLSNNLETANFNKFKKLVLRRKKKEPIAYIFKNKEFWKYNFKVNRGVLIPRPETEIIVNKTLKFISLNASKKILDIGTGSGCIMLSILKERPKCHGTAIDISKKALKVAIINAKMHHLQNKIKFINNDIDKFNYNKYDFILSNPPYINSIDIKRLDKDIILYEPLVALQAGIDGLREIRKLIKKSRKLLKKNGKLIFEIGKNQLIDVIKLLNKNKFYINEVCKDLQSHPRVIVSTKPF